MSVPKASLPPVSHAALRSPIKYRIIAIRSQRNFAIFGGRGRQNAASNYRKSICHIDLRTTKESPRIFQIPSLRVLDSRLRGGRTTMAESPGSADGSPAAVELAGRPNSSARAPNPPARDSGLLRWSQRKATRPPACKLLQPPAKPRGGQEGPCPNRPP